MDKDLITLTEAGLYCEDGGFYIDPWLPVDRAIITHAHSDHAQQGHQSYLTATSGLRLLKARLGHEAFVESINYAEEIQIGTVRVSLHSAGHVLGSSQVRIESKSGEVWVVSGDYKTVKDPTCDPFEPVKCHTFITESTFGLPIFKWSDPTIVYESINSWWQNNKRQGKASILYGYALGKIQRLLAGIDPSIGPIYTHGAVEKLVQVYLDSGVKLPETTYVGAMSRGTNYEGALILAPPSAQGTPWTRTFGTLSTGFASGWMRIRGTRRRKSVDRGFVLSDHADWNELQNVIKITGADRIIVTHGYTAEMVKWLSENGLNASSFKTHFEGESRELQAETEPESDSGALPEILNAQPEILNAQPEILDAQPEILDAQPEILDAQPEILDAQPEILDAQPEILDAQPEILDAQPEILDAQPEILDARRKISEAKPELGSKRREQEKQLGLPESNKIEED